MGTTPVRAYLLAVGAAVLALAAGCVLFPETVYDGFVWHYFWGPVQADANSALCAVREGAGTTYLYSQSECAAAAEPVAEPGYTLVSEVGYVVVLLVALSGVILLLRKLNIARDTDFFLALVPFFFFGGALRTVEDADDAMAEAALFPYPWNTLLISPVIYFTVFAVALAAVVGCVRLARNGRFDGFYRPLLVVGVALNVVTVGYLFALSLTPGTPVDFYPQVLVATLALTAAATAATWYATKRWAAWVHEGTGIAGLVVICAHALDGAANVVGLNWMAALVGDAGLAPAPPGVGGNLVPKHPVNAAIVDFSQSVFPPVLLSTLGDAWPFLLVKLVAATAVVAIFEREMFEESPRYAVLLLIAVTAVGMGPGTRDMLRATFGV
ncbi:membrane protein [Candidatus Halobonum tyrrellensis G22]|uniref:Membrane protein n=1 Tax=Candidatus Halobonum tyrrellensis G22 TaxID=1324957 RepID=V4HMF3_9EURY|nr:membrane protein [Candidatus Halobonum tyrrellensis G22]